MTPAIGLHRNIDRQEYDRLSELLNYSRLKVMDSCPAKFKHAEKYPVSDSNARKLGRVAHLAVLEPNSFEKVIAVWTKTVEGKKPKKGELPPPPSDKIAPRNGNAWEEFKAANVGKEIILQEEKDEALRIRDAVYKNKRAAELLSGGHSEVTAVFKLHGRMCKGRFDYLGAAIVDVKRTQDASEESFSWDCLSYLYHVQAAFYSDGGKSATGIGRPFYNIAVEGDAPHVVSVYRMPEENLIRGREIYQGWIEKLIHCEKRGHFGPYFEGEKDLILPRRAFDRKGEQDARAA